MSLAQTAYDAPTSPGVQRRAAPLLLAVAMLATGAAGLVTEYVLATVSTYILGNSVEQFSIIIALMMCAMGIAAALQRKSSDGYLIEKFVGVEVLLAVLGGFSPLIIYGAYAYLEHYFQLIQLSVVFSIGFLIGLEIPLVIRINEKYTGTLKSNLSWILSADFIGAFIGAIVWVKVLLANFSLTEVSFLVAGSNFFVAIITIAYFAKIGALKWKWATLSALVVTVVLLIFGFMHNQSWAQTAEQRLYDSRIVHAETSRYQRIVLTHDQRVDDWRLYLNGGLQFSSVDEAIYHEHLVHPVMALAPSRRNVLILGGGDGLALREVLRYPDVEQVTLVDIDPAIVRLASTHPTLRALNENSFRDARVSASVSEAVSEGDFREVYMEGDGVDQNGRPIPEQVASVRVLNVDAHRFVTELGDGPWDVVIIDFPDPDQVELAKLYSRELYRMLAHKLSPDGLIAIQATSPYHAREAYLCIGRTMEAGGLQVVPYHANVPSFGDWGWYLASPSLSASALHERLESIDTIPVQTRHLTPDLIRSSLAFGQGALDSEFTQVNSALDPVLLQFYTRYAWQQE